MLYRWGANAIVTVHFAFVAFVVLGGLAVLRWPRAALLHLPAAAWGAFIEYSGLICPLTPLENALRERGAEAGYAGGFVEHYLLPVLYPNGLTRHVQIVLGTLVVTLNVGVYLAVVRRWRRVRSPDGDQR
jgi:Protein of Unknown function (DUF2784)